MLCPFCKKTIHIEFCGGRWVAMRDDYEHSCIGLVKALAASQKPAEPAGDYSHHQRKLERDPSAVNHDDVKSTRPRTAKKSRRPVQLELQALE